MTDRELLELAAKAAGYVVFGDRHPNDGLNIEVNGRVCLWRPLHDDGDAFRLLCAVKSLSNKIPNPWQDLPKSRQDAWTELEEALSSGDLPRSRRAVTVLAAEIGKTL